MSYRLEYNWALFTVPPAESGLPEERFLVAIEGGDNNVRHQRTGKRARDWQVSMFGKAGDVMKQAVEIAGACASGCLQPLGRPCTPESYIARIRRLLEGRVKPTGWWFPLLTVAENHPAVALAASRGLELSHQVRYGEKEVQVAFTRLQLPLFFNFVDRFPEIPPWRLAQVGGLPNS